MICNRNSFSLSVTPRKMEHWRTRVTKLEGVGPEVRAVFLPRRKLKSFRRREQSERRSGQGHAGESLRLGSWVCFPPGALVATWRSGDDIDGIEWWQGEPSLLLLLSPPCGSGTVPDLHPKPVGGFSSSWSNGVGSGRGGRQWQVQGCT